MTSSTTERRLCAFSLAALLGVGCVSPPTRHAEIDVSPTQMATFTAGVDEDLMPLYERLIRDGRRNLVLNAMEIGLIHLSRSDFSAAGEMLDCAIDVVETYYVDDEVAASVRNSSFTDEDIKDFKGEPYERVMLYYYRGLAYLGSEQLENARACFRAAVAHDAIAEEEQHRCDFASMYLMQTVLARWAGEDSRAQIALGELQRLRPGVRLTSEDPRTLLIVETGLCPVKVVDGVEGERLTIHRNLDTRVAAARARHAEQTIELSPVEDLYWQASTRGGRPIDAFLAGKATYKSVAQSEAALGMEIGRTAQDLSLATGGTNAVASVIQGVSALRSVFAGRIRARADARHWRNLPERLHFGWSNETLSAADLEVEYLDSTGTRLASRAAHVIEIQLPHGRRVLWLRSDPVNLTPDSKR